MNIILPLGRLSTSLAADGYDKPLQMTPVLGRPVLFWLLDSLQLNQEADVVWLVVSSSDESTYQIYSALSAEYRDLKVNGRLRLVPLYFRTRGVVETLEVAIHYMTDVDMDRRTLCINGDMLFNPSICATVRHLPSDAVACFFAYERDIVQDNNPKNNEELDLWCHCEIEELCSNSGHEKHDAPMQEKISQRFVQCEIKKISTDYRSETIMMGAYAFGSVRVLELLIARVLDLRTPSSFEGKLGFPDLMQAALKISTINMCFGWLMPGPSCTPLKCLSHLETFIERMSAQFRQGLCTNIKSTRYLFQMYGGIMDDNDRPRKHVVEVVRELKHLGHHVTISSSRGRGANAVKTLIKQLDDCGICYDDIELNDHDRDYTVFVGSYVCDARRNLHKSLGIGGNTCKLEVIKPRHFNHILFMDNIVTKTSDLETISGEAFYYESIPDPLKHLFPTFLMKREEAFGKLSIQISKVEGVTFSQLLVNRCVDGPRLTKLLTSITELHSYQLLDSVSQRTGLRPEHSIWYVNYASKVEQRFHEHQVLYTRIFQRNGLQNASVTMANMIQALREYEDSKLADPRTFIHGDPVFSNCLLSYDGCIQFIDMNGKLGQTLTTSGDCAYDLAKILQSLYGYDYILLDVHMDETDYNILRQLRTLFHEHVMLHYHRTSWGHLQLLTASLLMSLVPMHDDFSHQQQFWQLGRQLFMRWQAGNVEG